MVLDRAAGTTISANYISGNTRNGVTISDFSDANAVDQNIIHDNGQAEGYGVAIYNGTGNTIRANALTRNVNGVLRLRDGDETVLDAYHRHGRLLDSGELVKMSV